jgi:hypothetical protein
LAELAWIKVHNQDKYKQLARRLKAAGRGDLQRRMTKEIRRSGDPALRAVQAAWMTVDVTSTKGGGSSSGLRARVAAATRISILGSGIRIRVESKRVDPRYGRSLSFGLDGLGRWRHPVYGNRDAWTQQTGQEVFYTTLERFEPQWRAGIERAMDETARLIEG